MNSNQDKSLPTSTNLPRQFRIVMDDINDVVKVYQRSGESAHILGQIVECSVNAEKEVIERTISISTLEVIIYFLMWIYQNVVLPIVSMQYVFICICICVPYRPNYYKIKVIKTTNVLKNGYTPSNYQYYQSFIFYPLNFFSFILNLQSHPVNCSSSNSSWFSFSAAEQSAR